VTGIEKGSLKKELEFLSIKKQTTIPAAFGALIPAAVTGRLLVALGN